MKKILIILIVFAFISCDKEDVNVTTGPLSLSSLEYEGVDFSSGVTYSATLANNANSVPVDVAFMATFSKAVDASTVNSNTISLSQGGSAIPVDVAVKDNIVTITPQVELNNDATYELLISNVLRATDGGLMAEEGSFNNVTRTLNTVGEPPYVPAGQVAYWPFNFDYDEVESGEMPTVEGTPGFAGQSASGPNAYQGATDSYLTFPTNNLANSEFTATFWYKIDATPDRAGILVMGPTDDSPPANNRTKGFRLFRENANGKQRITLNAGNGSADSWFNSAEEYHLATDADWTFVAFTISSTECVVYINGEVASSGAFSGIDWTTCDILSIGSGAPRFIEWGHLSDESFIDELRIFDVALPQSEIQKMME
ncbi:LamG-like jellyroll fold domain-containing protein [Fulvivirga ligni]|uniref:LamG-like jellyroll fold domain-containing protein n=1 Tax=Fulvivirga ligni TaxID=2904246 RepID=UPI001F1936F5|nr:LamG-like jellyroll fold domain-containing protein [Fulvivirga ligni]UII21989.1 Ig-like domain-containing protein [Fulvivirga ligni]